LFDVSDVLFPEFLTYLPHAEDIIPSTNGYNQFYSCISDKHLVVPFTERGFINAHKKDFYLVLYNLENPLHTMIVHTYKIPKAENLYSIVHSQYLGFDYLYVFVDDYVLVMKAMQNYYVNFPVEDLSLLKNIDKTYFLIYPNRNDNEYIQNMTLHSVKTGINLQSYQNVIQVIVTADEEEYRLNLDNFFEGFRDNINAIYSQSAGENAFKAVNDNTLLNLTHSILSEEVYEISSSTRQDEMQKALFRLKTNLYLYVDCKELLYIETTSGVLKVISSFDHGITGKITRVKYFSDYNYNPNPQEDSMGSIIMQYLINGVEEVIQICNVGVKIDPA
jgi:predicted house-cleaning noncanonical NTP pyrophosphatase (MazG superfamily)